MPGGGFIFREQRRAPRIGGAFIQRKDKEMEGTIKAWNVDRQYGFIRPDMGTQDAFLHISEVSPHGAIPAVGDRVRYEFRITEKGPRAYHAELVDYDHDQTEAA